MVVVAQAGTKALTKDFRNTIRDRAQREAGFRQGLLREGLELICNGDFATARAILRNYINATVGFPELARMTNISSPSLQRMFGPRGNPRAENLFGVIAQLQQQEGINVELRVRTH
jgi:DNA-binding phage protein